MKDEEYNVANFATLLSKTLIFSLPKMDEFNFFLLKLKTRAILRPPRPPSQQETKKIKSYHESWMFQDFLSFQAMKYMSCAKWRWGILGTDSSD